LSLIVARAETRKQQRLSGFKPGRREFRHWSGIHDDRLHEREIGDLAMAADLFRGETELVAESARERLVRAVARVESDAENVRCAVAKLPGRLAQAPRAHVAHERMAGDCVERAGQMILRDAALRRHGLERDRLAQVAFDEPKRLLHRIQGREPSEARRRALDRSCGRATVTHPPRARRITGPGSAAGVSP